MTSPPSAMSAGGGAEATHPARRGRASDVEREADAGRTEEASRVAAPQEARHDPMRHRVLPQPASGGEPPERLQADQRLRLPGQDEEPMCQA